METLRARILEVAEEIREEGSVTLRQLYYALTVRNVLTKTERDYKRLSQITSVMRREGAMPYDWIEDGSRVTHVPTTYESARKAIEELADRYLESPWSGGECAPEIWLEKDALSGVVYDVTYDYCVPLRVQRGYASLSALYRAAKDIVARARQGIKTQVYYLRDLDPSGADAARAAEATVRDMLVQRHDAAVRRVMASRYQHYLPPFQILGVTPQQVKAWKLPTRPNKSTDSRSANFAHASSVELDAIPPKTLRKLVVDAINVHMPAAALAVHEAQMESTREFLRSLAGYGQD